MNLTKEELEELINDEQELEQTEKLITLAFIQGIATGKRLPEKEPA